MVEQLCQVTFVTATQTMRQKNGRDRKTRFLWASLVGWRPSLVVPHSISGCVHESGRSHLFLTLWETVGCSIVRFSNPGNLNLQFTNVLTSYVFWSSHDFIGNRFTGNRFTCSNNNTF